MSHDGHGSPGDHRSRDRHDHHHAPGIPVEEHLAAILAAALPLDTVVVPLERAAGRATADAVRAWSAVPPFDNSAMDGYAVRAADTSRATAAEPVRLEVVAEVAAGSPADPALAQGQTVRIMTGAVLPSAADAIVPVEQTAAYRADRSWAEVGETVEVIAAARPHAFVRDAGVDLSPGDLVVPVGAVLTPYRLGAIAAAGVDEVAVRRAPRVAVITTGDELVTAGRRVAARGEIPDSNAVLLAGAVVTAGADVVSVSRVGDDPPRFLAEVERVVAEASADVVISTGGVSVGAHDPVKAALAPGGHVGFRAVDMQPGRPQAFGTLPSGALFFGLPGNPVSVAVSFEVFVRPALRALQGLPPVAAPLREVEVAEGWRPRDERRQYMPVRFDADGRIRPATAGGSGSHLAGALASAEGFAIVQAGVPEVVAGDILPVLEVAS